MYLFDSWFFIIIQVWYLKSWKKQKTRSLVWMRNRVKVTAQKMKFSIKDFFIFLCIGCFSVCFYRSDWLGGCGERHPEAYSGPCETSKMCFLFFVFVFFAVFCSAVNYFCKKLYLRYLKRFQKRLWHFLAFGLTLSRGRSLSHRN